MSKYKVRVLMDNKEFSCEVSASTENEAKGLGLKLAQEEIGALSAGYVVAEKIDE